MNKVNYGWNDASLRPDGWITVLSHEGGHHWLQWVSIRENGVDTTVLNPESAHPAAYVDTRAYVPYIESYDCSPMGGSRWTANGNGTFTSTPTYANISYSGYDLYLMGLLPAADVPSWFYLENCNPPVPLSYWPASNTTVSATQKNVTVTMLTDAMGARVPDSTAAPHDFFMPLVLVVRPGQEPSAEDWAFMLKVRDGYGDAFHSETADLGTTCVVSPREVSPPDAVPFTITQNGANLRFTFEDPAFPAGLFKYNLYRGDMKPAMLIGAHGCAGRIRSPMATAACT